MKAWQKAEADVAHVIGGRLVAGSGCSPMGGRGDVSTDRYLAEVKSTTTGRLKVTAKMLDKIEIRAMKDGKEPVLVVVMSGNGRPKWAVVRMVGAWRRKMQAGLLLWAGQARRSGLRLQKVECRSGDPWAVVPLEVFASLAKGGQDENG